MRIPFTLFIDHPRSDEEMLRDAHDDRLEVMMHKKRISEAVDNDKDL
jgi:hypothetical protein